MRRETDSETVGPGAQQRFRQLRGELLGVGAAALAGDFVLADRDEAQLVAVLVARRVPVALGAEIALFDVELVRAFAGFCVEPAAQHVEIGAGNAEERLGMLPPRADKGDEPPVRPCRAADLAGRRRNRRRQVGYAAA